MWDADAWDGAHGTYTWIEETFHWGNGMLNRSHIMEKYNLTLRHFEVSGTMIILV